MATITVTLKHGWKIGESTHKEVMLRELSADDIVEASLESERAVMTEHGYQFMLSPTLMGVSLLLRQLDQVGEFKGPFTRTLLSRLHRDDFEILQMHIEELDRAGSEAIQKRGRSGASESDAGSPAV